MSNEGLWRKSLQKDPALPQRSCKSMHSRTHNTTAQKYGKLSEPILVCLVLMLVRWWEGPTSIFRWCVGHLRQRPSIELAKVAPLCQTYMHWIPPETSLQYNILGRWFTKNMFHHQYSFGSTSLMPPFINQKTNEYHPTPSNHTDDPTEGTFFLATLARFTTRSKALRPVISLVTGGWWENPEVLSTLNKKIHLWKSHMENDNHLIMFQTLAFFVLEGLV